MLSMFYQYKATPACFAIWLYIGVGVYMSLCAAFRRKIATQAQNCKQIMRLHRKFVMWNKNGKKIMRNTKENVDKANQAMHNAPIETTQTGGF